MTSKLDKDSKTKQLQDKCQSVLNALLRDEDNKYCVDCDSKGPRWASWNIGVFLCIRCAGIHRNLGVHISKVKSVNLDAWTPEQVVSLQQMGNSRARAVYEANLPDNHRRPQNDTALETFIRAKYEHKKYIASEWVPPVMPKVNWEKEIDDELERLKRKKKSAAVESKAMSNVEVPQLPKPKNPSPKSGRSANKAKPVPASIEVSKEPTNTDLLGLQNGEDGFSGFLSASANFPAAVETPKTNLENATEIAKGNQSEEESFFNQTAPTEKEKAKLTKDSILALYSNTPSTNNFNTSFQNQPSFNAQFTTATAQQSNFQNFGVYPQQQQQQNGLGQFQNTQYQSHQTFPGQFNQMQMSNLSQQMLPQQQLTNIPQQMSNLPQQQLPQQMSQQMSNLPQLANLSQFPYQTQPTNNGQTFPMNPQFQQSQFGQLNQFQSNTSFPVQANNMYPNQSVNLQQQFGNLTLNNQPNSNNPPTLATTNLWQ